MARSDSHSAPGSDSRAIARLRFSARPRAVPSEVDSLRTQRAVPPPTVMAMGADEEDGVKRTYQPSKIRRARTHGFLVRMKTRGGRAVINARRAKGRKRVAV